MWELIRNRLIDSLVAEACEAHRKNKSKWQLWFWMYQAATVTLALTYLGIFLTVQGLCGILTAFPVAVFGGGLLLTMADVTFTVLRRVYVQTSRNTLRGNRRRYC